MTDYTDIISRLEKADDPDRGLDWMIHCINGMWGVGTYGNHPAYTSSLDAAISLTERLLPGWSYAITEIPQPLMLDGDKRFMVDLTGPVSFARGEYGQPEEPVYETAAGEAMHAPIALLIATFRALQAQDSEDK